MDEEEMLELVEVANITQIAEPDSERLEVGEAEEAEMDVAEPESEALVVGKEAEEAEVEVEVEETFAYLPSSPQGTDELTTAWARSNRIWVQCEACSKWRSLPPGTSIDKGRWECAMNMLLTHNRCDAPEEQLQEDEEEEADAMAAAAEDAADATLALVEEAQVAALAVRKERVAMQRQASAGWAEW